MSKADPKELLKYFLHHIRQTKLDQEMERLSRTVIFRTCDEHQEGHCAYTNRWLQDLGWYNKEELSEFDEALFPIWLVLLISVYAIMLVGALILGSSSPGQTNSFLLPPP